ncbi:hypothetical protein TRVL_06137 [Trypanosoma vivax]|nr:hypothetical protein TRVL_06137 [Trypanosoma vivax]
MTVLQRKAVKVPIPLTVAVVSKVLIAANDWQSNVGCSRLQTDSERILLSALVGLRKIMSQLLLSLSLTLPLSLSLSLRSEKSSCSSFALGLHAMVLESLSKDEDAKYFPL